MEKHHTYTMEFSQITPYIYIGSNTCCHKHSDKLIKRGVSADIDLETRKEDHIKPKGIKYFLWIPTKDNYAPSEKQLLLGVKTLEYLVQNKIKTYVHCRLGHGRSPTLVAAYFITKGQTAIKAFETIKKKRLEAHLFPRQKKALKTFEKKWKGSL